MGYNIACFEELVANGYDVHCVHWTEGLSAPYLPKAINGVRFYPRSSMDEYLILDLCKEIKPKAILVSGWMDMAYLRVCHKMRKTVPTVAGVDNWWFGTIRQRIASLFSRALVRKYFSHLFVPGVRQLEFARRLGFADSNILHGLYTCNTKLFTAGVPLAKESLSGPSPKVLLFVGRFAPEKGIVQLLRAFNRVSERIPDWFLKMYGSGPLLNELQAERGERSFIHDFESQEKLVSVYRNADVFCLPSLKEPWGLVVHEATCCGLPLLTSDRVGASTALLEEGRNGFLFDPSDPEQIADSILKMTSLSAEERRTMSLASLELSKKFNEKSWVKSFLKSIA